MVKTVTPFSTRAKEGATDSPLGDFVDVPQVITSTASAGFFDENGKLTGNTSTDRQWQGFTQHIEVANGAAVTVPQTPEDYIDMGDFNDIFIAIKPTNGGNCAIEAVMGPDTNTFLGLEPVNAAAGLKWIWPVDTAGQVSVFQPALLDSAESLTVDVWNIFAIVGRLSNQRMMQFKLTNNSGGISTIDFAYLRVA